MRRTMLTALSIAALMLSACTADTDAAGAPAAEEATPDSAPTITVAVRQAPAGYNGNTASAGASSTDVDNLTSSGFAAFAAGGRLEANTDFGTYEKISDDPLTIRYSIDEKAVWSDGVPIDYDDVLLAWAAMSGTHPSGEKDPVTGAEQDLFQAASTGGFRSMERIEGEPGDKEFVTVFTEPYADWESLFTTGVLLPAHVVAEQSGLSAEGAGAELVEAIRAKDQAALASVAAFWNTGWNYGADLSSLPDTAVLPSSGPYRLDDARDGMLMLVRNEKYWGEERAARTDGIVLEVLDEDDAVQALRAGDVDILEHSDPTVGTRAALEQIGGTVTVATGQSLTFSHVDLDQRPGAVFEDLRVRRAFAKCIPRAEMVDTFVSPIHPEGTVLNLREYQPAQDDYPTVLGGAPAAQDDGAADVEGAKALLAEAGRSGPVPVSLMYASTSQLRAEQVALIKRSCDTAGFDVIPQPDAEWRAKLSQPGAWDAVVFGWAGSGLVASGQSLYVTGGEQNFGGYSDAEVDSLWNRIVTTTDADAVLPLKTALEQRLAETQYNVVLYTHPTLVAHSSKLRGAEPNPRSGITWNAHSWTKEN